MMTVLVVDDQLSHREMISSLLKKVEMKIISASNGVEALEQIKIQKPDLVILDIVMPEMNGYEVCRRIKSNPQTKDLPVIFCSVKGEEFDRYWGMKSAADAYVVKPFHPQELIDTVQQFLQ